uniref:amidoligase family protein n=1 Tax=Anaerocolumna sedimenticola TaxID=2696063 RepID=UPI001FEB16A6|nr:amidoligase family protein [Anaerocolumna sedimenticola]
MAAKVVASVLNSSASAAQGGCYHTRTITDTLGRDWKIMRDSSIHEQTASGYANDEHKVEFVTPPLKYVDIELLQNIVRDLKIAGAMVNSSCGIHIHVDGANHTPQSLRRLINFMTARQDLIYEALEIGGSAMSIIIPPDIMVLIYTPIFQRER